MGLAVLLVACATAPEPAVSARAPRRPGEPRGGVAIWDYRVSVAEDLSAMDVRVCFDGKPPEALVPITGLGDARITLAEASSGRALEVGASRIVLGPLPRGACVHYRVSWVLEGESFLGARRAGQDVLLSQSCWLLRPEPLPKRGHATLRVESADVVRAFLPWPEGDGLFELGTSAFTLSAHTAFGELHVDSVDVPGAAVRFAILGDPSAERRALVRRWLFEAASAVSLVDGRFPVDDVAVMVLPAAAGDADDPVAFGLVRRGGGASVMLLLREGADPDATVRDWVATHEFTHLTTPPLARSGAWLSEGLATYYQEVLRARRGLITPLEAWRNLDAGFGRGRREGGTGRPLRKEAADMRRTHAFRHVYWSGTAFALELDLRLRQRTKGEASLDLALARLREDAARAARPWSSDGLLERMDALLGTDECTRLGRVYEQRSEFPDVTPLFEALGLERGEDGLLYGREAGEQAALRAAIMRGNRSGRPTALRP